MSNRERTLLAFLIIIILVTAAYANTFTSAWHFDDNTSIVYNPRIHLQEISISSLREVLFPSTQGVQTDRPVAHLSFALNWYFAQQNSFSYHLLNVLIHVAASFFVFLIITTCYKSKYLRETPRGAVWAIALLSSLLWALNPIQTQAVTYIVQRMASMAAFFYLAGLWCYLSGRLTETRGRYFYFIASLIFFLLALGTKQNTVVFPVSLLLLELIFLQKSKLLRRVGSFTIISAILVTGMLVYFLLDFRYDFSGKAFSGRSFDLMDRVLTEPRIVMGYLGQIFYPLPWRFSIIHDVAPSSSLFKPVSTVLSIITIFGLIIFAVIKRKKFPILAFAVLFFFLNHLVESTVIPLELVFEHRNYLPTAFLFWPIASVVVEAAYKRRDAARLLPYGISTLIVLCVLSFGLWTYQRNSMWATEETLWGDALKKAPDMGRPYLALAESARQKGMDELALKLYQESLNKKHASPTADKFVIYHNMAHIYFERGELKRAERFYREALVFKPYSNLAMYNLAHTLVLSGRYDEADVLLAVAMNKNDAGSREDFLAMKGFVLLKKGSFEEAEHYFRSAYFAGNRNKRHLVGRACSLVKSDRHAEAATLLTVLLWDNEALPDSRATILFLALENELRAGNVNRAQEIVDTLLAHYPLDDLGRKLIIGYDDLPLDTELLKEFLRTKARELVVYMQQLHK